MAKIWVKREGEEPFSFDDSTDLGRESLADALKNGSQIVNKEKADDGSARFEIVPDTDWTVKEIRKWMASNKIKCGASDKKATLLDKVIVAME